MNVYIISVCESLLRCRLPDAQRKSAVQHASEEISQNETTIIAIGPDQHCTVLDLDKLHHN
jgi:hypothetical protein